MKQNLDVESLFAEGLNFYKSYHFHPALTRLNQVLEVNPNHCEAWYYKGKILIDWEEYSQAIESFERFLDLTSTLSFIEHRDLIFEVFFQCGISYASINNHEQAIENFNEAIEISSEHEEVWLWRGHSYYYLNNLVETTNSYETALSLNQNSYLCWHHKGKLAYRINSFEYAIFLGKKALSCQPDDPCLLIEQGNYLLEIGNYEVALECFEFALESSPFDYDAVLRKGICLMRLRKRPWDIKDAFKKCLELEPDNALSWYWEGEWLISVALHSNAIHSFDRAINLSPTFEAAWSRRSELLQKLGFYQAAVHSNNAIISISQQDWRTLGIILFHSELYEGALNVFEEILKVRLGDCDIWNYKTQVLINLGRTQDAENSAKQSQMQGCQVYAPTK